MVEVTHITKKVLVCAFFLHQMINNLEGMDALTCTIKYFFFFFKCNLDCSQEPRRGISHRIQRYKLY